MSKAVGSVLFWSFMGWSAVIAAVGLTIGATLSDPGDVARRDSQAVLPALTPARSPVERLVRPADSTQLEAVFDSLGYSLESVRRGDASVPRLFVMALPPDLAAVEPTPRRKALFLASVLPLVLAVNEELRDLRRQVLALLGAKRTRVALDSDQRAWLARVATRYDLAVEDGLARLLLRVDEIPVSLVLAQAIEESGWGGSRFARDGNALFGQRAWTRTLPGLAPTDAGAEPAFSVRSFLNLLGAVRSYMHNLNTHEAYAELRAQRARRRASGLPVTGHLLSGSLLRYSERREAYVVQLRRLISSNGLEQFERARLTQALPEAGS